MKLKRILKVEAGKNRLNNEAISTGDLWGKAFWSRSERKSVIRETIKGIEIP